jgi:1-phosphofructokinase family hexose kinase
VILCVTPSPAVDRTARVARLTFGAILRPTEVSVLPGGKGNNVARAVCRLGALVTTTGFAGGHAGRWLVEALEHEGLNPRFVTVASETRTTYVTLDSSGRSVLVYEPSAPVGVTDVEALLALLTTELLPTASWVAICGSPPAGMPAHGYTTLVNACRSAGRPSLVDVGGPALAAALAARPDIAKVSREEAASVLPDAVGDTVAAARALVGLGATLAVVTDGPRGAGAADARSTWQVEVPRITAVDPIGSGDAFSAGLLVALDAGRSTEEALASAAAAGTANAEMLGAGRFDSGRHAALTAQVRVTRHSRQGGTRGAS